MVTSVGIKERRWKRRKSDSWI